MKKFELQAPLVRQMLSDLLMQVEYDHSAKKVMTDDVKDLPVYAKQVLMAVHARYKEHYKDTREKLAALELI